MMQQGGSSNPRLRPIQPARLAPPPQRKLCSMPRPNYPNKKNLAPQSYAPAPALVRGSPIKRKAPRRSAKTINGRLNHVNAEEAHEALDIVLGRFLVNSVP